VRVLERQTQLEALTEYAGEARAGQGRLVLVAGEAGVGKSTLVERLEAQLPDARWFWGACDGLFTPRPLAPLVDVAAELGGDLAAGLRSGADRGDLFSALLRQVDQPGTLTVLVVEDVHWADEATLDLLRFLGRRIRGGSVLVVVTYRDDALPADDPLRVALGELSTQRSTRRVDVPRLTREAVGALAAGTDIDPEQLYDLTGGNPFFVVEVLRAGVASMPTSARDAVLARVAGLSEPAHAVLEVAALAGPRVDVALLDAVVGAPPSAIDELLAAGLLAGDGDRLRFRHELARLAVEQAIPAHRRTTIHRAVLDVLRDADGADDTRLAFHAEGAGDAELVLEHAPAAGRRASELAAHREAAAQYERALRFAGSTDARTRARLHDELAYELSLVDRWEESALHRGSALELWREVGDLLRVGDDLQMYARTMWRLCRGEEERAAAAEGLAVLEALGPGPELAKALVYGAGQLAVDGQPGPAVAMADRAIAMAGDFGLPEVLSDGLNTKACVLADQRDASWRDLMEEALQVAVDKGLHQQAGRAYANLHEMALALLAFPQALQTYVDGVAYCDEHDIATYGTCLRGGHVQMLARTGGWSEAVPVAEAGLASTASPVNRLNPLINLGRIAARQGDARAWALLDEADVLADGVAEPGWQLMARLARAEARWIDGDDDAARLETRRALDVADTCDRGFRAEAGVWWRRLTGEVVVPVDSAPEPYASQLRGEVGPAALGWEDLGSHYDAALALADSTDGTVLRESLARLEALGAPAVARRVRQRMRDLGIRSVPAGARASTRSNPAGLTTREREVLVLLVDGRSNEEISAQLVISVKTVDHHVSAVLGKLGVPSRKVAAREAVRLGLVSADSG
jgi:DNA-binding CsgD family transcriptional regulator